MNFSFGPKDLVQLAEHGVSESEARRQLALLENPPAPQKLLRPCTVSDGVLRLSEAETDRYEQRGREALAQGRVTKFVPASGAATRMFKALLSDPDGAQAEQVRRRFADFAFAGELSEKSDPIRALLERYATLPKALIPFHFDSEPRTALVEQLREAHALGVARVHFSVSEEHRARFEELAERARADLQVDFSVQDPATDTLAYAPGGGPFRDEEGKLVFRPAGHGALLENVQKLGADLVLIKNIDNIAHERMRAISLCWLKVLVGLLLEREFVERPVRVCAVVPNTGEPGGGPFWVAGTDTPQIVESAQVDLENAQQRSIFEASTHFNPVVMAGRLRDSKGVPFELARYRDEAAGIVTTKSMGGRELRALERPGLWNGSMARWETLFVEAPLEIFTPVKELVDLLKPPHQPAR